MATNTTNYNLVKPAGTDNCDIDVLNGNMDIIDSTMKTISDGVTANASDISTLGTGKMPVVAGAGDGNMAVFDSNGKVVDGGLKLWVDDGILKITY